MNSSGAIGFRPLALSDIALMQRWLTTGHVARWYDSEATEYGALEAKYGAYIRGEKPTKPFLILHGETPIGYLQTYRIADWQDYAQHLGLAEDAAGLDLFIGEPGFLHKGLGPHVIRRFLREHLFPGLGAQSCVIGPEAGNRAAIRAYAKAGFSHLRTVAVPGEAEPEYLMRITPAELEPFLGSVILESLLDEAPLAGLAPILERVSAVPDDPDATVWHNRWYLLDRLELEERLPALAGAMRRNWYAHFWRGDDLWVILPGKVFRASASDKGTWAELIAYGETVGVGRRWTATIPTVAPAYVQAALGQRS